MDVKGKRVFVGLSGGVDSAVAAYLLKERGALVTGVFIKGWYPPGLPCSWALERRDAMRVAARLKIPFETLDASASYKRAVIDYLRAEYRAGRTPNPDIMCNRDIKFGAFYAYARSRGASYVATGHYVDGPKDQRYFLWAVPKEVFANALFPLEGKTKDEIRAIARAKGLPVAEKPDSVGVCFLGDVSVHDFLREEFGAEEGEAVDSHERRVASHEGARLYTLGERFPVAGAEHPWYVVGKDVARNQLTVAPERASPSARTELSFTNANWLLPPETAAFAVYRYRGARVRGRVERNAFVLETPLFEPLASGQSLVFFDGADRLVGGALLA